MGYGRAVVGSRVMPSVSTSVSSGVGEGVGAKSCLVVLWGPCRLPAWKSYPSCGIVGSVPTAGLEVLSVERSGDRIVRLIENPITVQNDILGIATFIVNPEAFKLLEQAFDNGTPSIDFVSFVDGLIRDGHSVKAFELTGEYINLNDVPSLEAANDMAIRDRLTKSEK